MSGTPPSSRKRPQCHSCGTLMAGHRRVNGKFTCPNDDDTSNATTETTTPSPRRSARLNYSPQEQQTPPLSSPHPGPSNWDPSSRSRSAKRERTVSPAPTVLSEEYCKTEDDSFYTENGFTGSPGPSRPGISKIGPTSSLLTFTQKFRLSTPLASIFTAPRSDIDEVQQEAGRYGMYTGVVYKPRKIKEEESQRWVVMGRDPETVDRLVDFQRKDVARQLEPESRTSTPNPVPASGARVPPIACGGGPSMLRNFITFALASFLGAFILFYLLVYVL